MFAEEQVNAESQAGDSNGFLGKREGGRYGERTGVIRGLGSLESFGSALFSR